MSDRSERSSTVSDVSLENAKAESKVELRCAISQLDLMAEIAAQLDQLDESEAPKRFELQQAREDRRERAGTHIRLATEVLYDARAELSWSSVRPDIVRFLASLPSIGTHVLSAVNRPELASFVSDALQQRTAHWAAQCAFESTIKDGSAWRERAAEFRLLREQEQNTLPNARDVDLVHAIGTYPSGNVGHGDWRVFGSIESFRTYFQTRAIDAGIALADQDDVAPLNLWLDRLFRDLLEAKSSRFLKFSESKEGGLICYLFEASAAYSAKLEGIALENERRLRQSAGRRNDQQIAPTAEPELISDRKALVRDFMTRTKAETGLRVTKKLIWLAAGHKHPRQFQHWQAGKDRVPGSKSTSGATAEDNRNFRRILSMRPADFGQLLKEKSQTSNNN